MTCKPMRKTIFQGLLRRPLTEAPPRQDATTVRAREPRSSLQSGPQKDALVSVDDPVVVDLGRELNASAVRLLGRSLSIRALDAGSCNGCELELNALNNAFYDLERFGLRFVASPRHADVLTVTGPVTRNMRQALERTYQAMPHPKWVVGVGTCARGGGLFVKSPECLQGVADALPVDLWIAGCPPSPLDLLTGLLALFQRPSRRSDPNGQ